MTMQTLTLMLMLMLAMGMGMEVATLTETAKVRASEDRRDLRRQVDMPLDLSAIQL